jgi:hypothetical protein
MDPSLILMIIFVLYLVRFYLPSYFTEKGKNLATKEDMAKIEKEIQEVRSKYSKDLELLKSELTRRSYIHGLRYENEFKLLKQLWQKLVDLERAAILLRPEAEYADPSKSDQEKRMERLGRLYLAIKAFLDVVEKNQPFYPNEIAVASGEPMAMVREEEIQYRNRKPDNDPDHWDFACKNSEEIKKKRGALLDLIKERITLYEG